MILAVDIGNTDTVIGILDNQNRLLHTFQIGTATQKTSWEYAAEIKQIVELAHVNIHHFDGAIICSVVPELNFIFREAIRILTGIKALILGAGVRTGLNIRLDDPGSIAGDMVATAVAAREEYPLPAFIVCMGTATFITVVDAGGEYLGGSIMPGAAISLKALKNETSLLPAIDFAAPRKVIGTNTVDAMRSGLVYGNAGAIDGILDRYTEEIGEPGSIIATGGLSGFLAPYCRHRITVDEHLLLKGLGIIWQRNQKGARAKGKNTGHNSSDNPERRP